LGGKTVNKIPSTAIHKASQIVIDSARAIVATPFYLTSSDNDIDIEEVGIARFIESKYPDAVIFQTNIQDSYSLIAGARKYDGKGCATIIVLPGR
jgi:hypothetical protein